MPVLCEFDNTQTRLVFPHPFVDHPRLAHGFRKLDISRNANIRVRSTLQRVTCNSADCSITPWDDTTLHSAVDSVFALAPADLDFLTGEHMRNLWSDRDSPASVRIRFERPFVTPPKVVVFLNCLDFDKGRNYRVKTTASGIDERGFTLTIETWSNTILWAAQACWIAYPEDREHIFSTSINTLDVRPWDRPQPRTSNEITLGMVEFWKKPTVFIALNYLDISCWADLRVDVYIAHISTTRLLWHIDSWDDTILHSAGASIIAFN